MDRFVFLQVCQNTTRIRQTVPSELWVAVIIPPVHTGPQNDSFLHITTELEMGDKIHRMHSKALLKANRRWCWGRGYECE